MAPTLQPAQRQAIEHVGRHAAARSARAREVIAEVLEMSNLEAAAWTEAVRELKTHARVTLHFHPDRLDNSLRSVAASLLEGGVYRSQFETRISSGALSAFPGGSRYQWESALFGGAYDSAGSADSARPKYGALDVLRFPDGAAPRFGSCFLVLRPEVSARSTFTYLDSHHEPEERGTLEELDDVLAALLSESFVRRCALGACPLTPPDLVRILRTELAPPFHALRRPEPSRNLDLYIEAQVHGDVRLDADVQELVADPSFRGGEIGELLDQLSERYRVPLRWHLGFSLRAGEVPDDFRGPGMPSLARRVARDGIINARLIGEAAASVKRNATAWSDRGTPADVLQELKLLWHVLVRYGAAAQAPPSRTSRHTYPVTTPPG